jgi:anaerobic magnesium-protoporphyrin IX monomethyl ester cyclase
MKILFLQNDPFYRLGLMALGAYLHDRGGHDVEAMVFRGRPADFARIEAFMPDLVGFYVTSMDAAWTLGCAGKIKQWKEIPIVVGGPHPTFVPEFIHDRRIDFLCQGEGEEAILELAARLQSGESPVGIANLSQKDRDGVILQSDLAPLIDPLDSLPFPRWQIYRHYPRSRSYYRHVYPIIVGRGCPGTCSFCCMNQMRAIYRQGGRFIRLRSPEHVIEELRLLKRDFPVVQFMLEDDSFLLNIRWLEKYAELYCREIRLPFTCQAAAPLIRERSADLLKEMGCITVRVGLETGNEDLRRQVLKKRVRNTDLERAASLLHDRGISLQTYNMFGIPGETVEQSLETYSLNRKIGTNFAWSSQLRPFPGTEILAQSPHPPAPEFWESGHSVKNYFRSSTDFPLDHRTENLQQFLQIFLKLRLSESIVRKLIELPGLSLFYPLFALTYAWSVQRINRIPLKPFLTMALQARKYLTTTTDGDDTP